MQEHLPFREHPNPSLSPIPVPTPKESQDTPLHDTPPSPSAWIPHHPDMLGTLTSLLEKYIYTQLDGDLRLKVTEAYTRKGVANVWPQQKNAESRCKLNTEN